MKKNIDIVSVRLVKDRDLYSQEQLTSPEAVVRVLGEELKQYDREVLAVVNLQNNKTPININIVSIGTVNQSIADPSNIFKTAILSNAESIILLHNHPSGQCTPSKADIAVTDRINKCGSLLGIKLLDHIIVGNKETYSFMEHGMIENPDLEFEM